MYEDLDRPPLQARALTRSLAPPWREDLLFRLGTRYQERTEWHLRRPALPRVQAQAVDRNPGAA